MHSATELMELFKSFLWVAMPEIVTKAILPTIQTDKDFPIMSLVVDEMTGEAGFITRIEAFIDMLSMKRNAKYRNTTGDKRD